MRRSLPLRALTAVRARAMSTLAVARPILARPAASQALPARKFIINKRFMSSFPDHNILRMPALSPTMEKGNIASWFVEEGQQINAGDALCDVETDKATLPWESVEDGYVAKILVPAGSQDVAVGTAVCVIVDEEGDVSKFGDFSAADAGSAPAASQPAPEPAAAHTPPPAPGPPPPTAPVQPPPAPAAPAPAAPAASAGRVVASPFARTVAAQSGVDLSQVPGTGPNNRVIAADVKEFAPKFAAPAARTGEGYTDLPLNNVRKVIAQRLVESKTTIPHFYLTIDVRVDALLAARAKLNEELAGSQKLSVNDFVIKASAMSMRHVPEVNSAWMGDVIRQHNYVDICVAVATDNGLITPIVKDADLQGLASINANVKDLAGRARENKLLPEEFQGGTFTISNLGMFGIKQFAAIINPPQSAILAVGNLNEVVIPTTPEDATKFGQTTEVATMMSVTLSCDHRVVDGAVGAQWLQHFKDYVEKPYMLLL